MEAHNKPMKRIRKAMHPAAFRLSVCKRSIGYNDSWHSCLNVESEAHKFIDPLNHPETELPSSDPSEIMAGGCATMLSTHAHVGS